MANLSVEVKVGKGGHSPDVRVDKKPVEWGDDGKGTVEVDGHCGDESNHIMLADFMGPVGATMGVTISCSESVVCEVKEMLVYDYSEPFGGTQKKFRL